MRKRGGFAAPFFVEKGPNAPAISVVSMRHSGKTLPQQRYVCLDVFNNPSEDINGSA